MRTWVLLLSGLLVWAIHFFTLYAIASIWLTTPFSRGLTLALTLACVIAIGILLIRASNHPAGNAMDRWVRSTSLVGLGISGVAIMWQGLPALLI